MPSPNSHEIPATVDQLSSAVAEKGSAWPTTPAGSETVPKRGPAPSKAAAKTPPRCRYAVSALPSPSGSKSPSETESSPELSSSTGFQSPAASRWDALASALLFAFELHATTGTPEVVIAACAASLLIVAPTVSGPTQSPLPLRTLAAIWSPLAPICGQAASWEPSAPVAMSRQRRPQLGSSDSRWATVSGSALQVPPGPGERSALKMSPGGPGDALTSLVTAHAAVAVPSGLAVTATESRYGRSMIATVSCSPHSPPAGR